jgi:hypothetical protein
MSSDADKEVTSVRPHICDENCWETWTETEDGRLISYTANTCEYSADPED